MTNDDPLVELREALTAGVEAVADLLMALEAVPAAMEAALNRFGRPTTTAQAIRRHAEHHVIGLTELQEVWAMALEALPEPDAVADRVGEWFRRQVGGPGKEGA